MWGSFCDDWWRHRFQALARRSTPLAKTAPTAPPKGKPSSGKPGTPLLSTNTLPSGPKEPLTQPPCTKDAPPSKCVCTVKGTGLEAQPRRTAAGNIESMNPSRYGRFLFVLCCEEVFFRAKGAPANSMINEWKWASSAGVRGLCDRWLSGVGTI